MTHRIQQESIKRRLAKLAAPIFIETLLIMMLGAVDTIMLSRHSDNSVAAVGVVNQIIMLTFLVFEVINLGTSVLCSQYLGARLEKKVYLDGGRTEIYRRMGTKTFTLSERIS